MALKKEEKKRDSLPIRVDKRAHAHKTEVRCLKYSDKT